MTIVLLAAVASAAKEETLLSDWAVDVLSGHDRWQPKFIWQTEALNKLKAHFQLAVVRSQYGMHCILCSAYITTHFKFGSPNTDQSPHRI